MSAHSYPLGQTPTPVRLVVSEADPQTLFALQRAAFDLGAEQVAVVSVATTLEALLQNLGNVEAEVVLLDGEFARETPARADPKFLKALDRLGRAVAVVMLPQDLAALGQTLAAHPKVRDVAYKPVGPLQTLQRVVELAQAERERLYEADPLAHREVMLGAQSVTGQAYPQTTICFAAFKGGPGKSTLALNTWYAINYHGIAEALLLSLDVPDANGMWLKKEPTPNMGAYFNRPDQGGFRDSLQYHSINSRQAPLMLAVPSHQQREEANQTGKYATLLQMAKERYGVVVIDTPPTITMESILAMQKANRVALVVEPNEADVQNVAAAIQALDAPELGSDRRVNREQFVYVQNKVTEHSNLPPREMEARWRPELRWTPPLLAQVPYDPRIPAWQNSHEVAYAKGGPLTDAVDQLLQYFFPRTELRRAGQSATSAAPWPGLRRLVPQIRLR